MPRFKLIAFSLFCICIVVSLSSCASPRKAGHRIQHYNLEYPPPQFNHLKPLPLVIKMESFSASPIYNTSRILYRDQSFNLKAYNYHHWRANPADLARHFLQRDLRASGLYSAILPHSSRLTSDYVLEGAVNEFLEWDGDEGWEAVLSLTITFVKRGVKDSRKAIIMQKDYQTREPCRSQNPLAVVEAMSRAMARTSEQIISDLHAHLQGEP